MSTYAKSILLIFYITSISFYAIAMDQESIKNFINKKTQFAYTFDGTYRSGYKRIKSPNETQSQQLKQLKDKLENVANNLKRPLAELVAEYANIILAFPKERPTLQLYLKVMMEKTAVYSELAARKTYDVQTIVKDNLSKDEENEYSQFKSTLESIALHSCDDLMDLVDNYSNLIALKENDCAMSLDIDLYMYRS